MIGTVHAAAADELIAGAAESGFEHPLSILERVLERLERELPEIPRRAYREEVTT